MRKGFMWAALVAITLTTQDYIDIQQLYASYNHALDTGDAAAYVATFTGDGAMNTAVGTQGLTDNINNWTKGPFGGHTRHVTLNLLIKAGASAKEATGLCYLTVLDVGVAPAVNALTGKYEDILVKTAAGWRFKKRALTIDPRPAPKPKN